MDETAGGLLRRHLERPASGGQRDSGIGRHICSAYHWLASHYAEGDAIYLFGFSRGAFPAPSLAGFLARGIPSFLGPFEGLFKKVSGNLATDFLGTKRVEKFPWFTLVGAIANDAGSSRQIGNDGSPVPHQYVEPAAHADKPFEVKSPGYLYCFPNDVWSL